MSWPTWPCLKCGRPVGPGLDGDWELGEPPYGYTCTDGRNHETSDAAYEAAREWARTPTKIPDGADGVHKNSV